MAMSLWASVSTFITDAKAILNEYTHADGGMGVDGVDNMRALIDKLNDVQAASTLGAANNAAVTVAPDTQVTTDEPNPDPAITTFVQGG